MDLNALYRITLPVFFLSARLILKTEGILLKNDEGINMALMEQKLTALETSVESLKSQCGKLIKAYNNDFSAGRERFPVDQREAIHSNREFTIYLKGELQLIIT